MAVSLCGGHDSNAIVGLCRDEDGLHGGIIVQDCLELVNNLLRGNHGNQLMFRQAQRPRQADVPAQAACSRLM